MELRQIGSLVFEGPRELLCRLPTFHTPPLPVRRVRLSRSERYRHPLAPPTHSDRGSYEDAGDALLAGLSDDPLAGQSAAMAALAYLLSPGGLLVHSAGLVVKGRAVVALGSSGAGKSTLSRLASPLPLLSDEGVGLAATGEGWVAFGAPVRSSCDRPHDPGCYPLGALLALRKGPGNAARPLAPSLAASAVLSQSHLLDVSPAGRRLAFEVASEMASRVPAYELEFTLDGDPAEILRAIDFR